jgi:hypothetical protein
MGAVEFQKTLSAVRKFGLTQGELALDLFVDSGSDAEHDHEEGRNREYHQDEKPEQQAGAHE